MYFCPKQGQDFKPPAAPLYPNMGQVPPPECKFFCENLFNFLKGFNVDMCVNIPLCKVSYAFFFPKYRPNSPF